MNLTARSLYPEKSATGIDRMKKVWAVRKTKISVPDGYIFFAPLLLHLVTSCTRYIISKNRNPINLSYSQQSSHYTNWATDYSLRKVLVTLGRHKNVICLYYCTIADIKQFLKLVGKKSGVKYAGERKDEQAEDVLTSSRHCVLISYRYIIHHQSSAFAAYQIIPSPS